MTKFILPTLPKIATEGEPYEFTLTPLNPLTEETTIYWEIIMVGVLPARAHQFTQTSGTANFVSGAVAGQTISISLTDDSTNRHGGTFELRIYEGSDNSGTLIASQRNTLVDDDRFVPIPLPQVVYGSTLYTDRYYGDTVPFDNRAIFTLGASLHTTYYGGEGDDTYIITPFQYGTALISDNSVDGSDANLIKIEPGTTITQYAEVLDENDPNIIAYASIKLATGAGLVQINRPQLGKHYQIGDDKIIENFDDFKKAIGAFNTNNRDELPIPFFVPHKSENDNPKTSDDNFNVASLSDTATEGEDYTFTITPSAALTEEKTLYWEIVRTGQIPVPSADFTARSGMITFAAGAEEAQTITLPIIDDDIVEVQKTFELRIYEGTDNDGTLIANQNIQLNDNDERDFYYLDGVGFKLLRGRFTDSRGIGEVHTLGGNYPWIHRESGGKDIFTISRYTYNDVLIDQSSRIDSLLKIESGLTIVDYYQAENKIYGILVARLHFDTGGTLTIHRPIHSWVYQLGDGEVIDNFEDFKLEIGASGNFSTSTIAAPYTVGTNPDRITDTLPFGIDQRLTIIESVEEGEVIATVEALDGNTDDIFIFEFDEITQSNFGAFFAINSETGEITYTGGFDFNHYIERSIILELGIRVKSRGEDGSGREQTIQEAAAITRVVIKIEADSPPILNDQTITISEDIANNTAIGQIVATDKNAGDVIVYEFATHTQTLYGHLFSINREDGTISTRNEDLDYDSFAKIVLNVVALSSGGEGSGRETQKRAEANVTLNIQKVESAPTFSLPSYTLTALNENNLANVRVNAQPIKARDENHHDELHYRLIGEDSAFFTYDGRTGYFYVNGSADYETKSQYVFTLEVSDRPFTEDYADDRRTAQTQITMDIRNIVNETLRGFNNIDFVIGDGIITLDLRDYFTGETTPTFTLSGNPEGVALSAENNYILTIDPTVAGEYRVSVAGRSEDGTSLSKEFSLFVVEDSPPTTVHISAVTISEDRGAGHIAYISGRDANKGDIVSFRFTDETQAAYGHLFTVNSDHGEIIYNGQGLDFDTASIIRLYVTVASRGSIASGRRNGDDYEQTATAEVVITVTEGLFTPQFPQSSYILDFAEAVGERAVLMNIVATDENINDDIYYKLSGRDKHFFTYDEELGAIRFAGIVDYETQQNYRFTLEAGDRPNGEGRTARTTFNVNILDNTEEPDHNFEPLTFTLGSHLVEIDLTTIFQEGELLTFSAENTPEGVSITGNTLSILPTQAGVSTIKISGRDIGGQIFSKDLELNVVEDIAPHAETVYKTLREDTPARIVARVNVIDNPEDVVSYRFTDYTQEHYGRIFIMGGISGSVIYGAGDDLTYDEQAKIELDIILTSTPPSDSGRAVQTGTTKVLITLTQVQYAPVFAEEEYIFELLENSISGAPVGNIAATDENAGDIMYYELIGEDADAFYFNKITGQLSFKGIADKETKDTYSFNIIARDEDSPTAERMAQSAVVVTILDVEEPVITDTIAPTARAIPETISIVLPHNHRAGDLLPPMTINMHDYFADNNEENVPLQFRLIDNLQAGISLDKDTGILTIIPSFLSSGSIDVQVAAIDGAGNAITQTFPLSVSVGAPIATDIVAGNEITITLAEDSGRQEIATLSASSATPSDIDYVFTDETQEAYGDLFGIGTRSAYDSASPTTIIGREAFITYYGDGLDYDSTTEIILNVRIYSRRDPENTQNVQLRITIEEADFAPRFAAESYTFALEENGETSTIIGTVPLATDKNAGDSISYMFSGADASLFTFDETTGAITFNARANFEEKAVYVANLIAMSGDNTAQTQITLNIENDEDLAVLATTQASTATAENGLAAGQITSIDTGYRATITDEDSDDADVAYRFFYDVRFNGEQTENHGFVMEKTDIAHEYRLVLESNRIIPHGTYTINITAVDNKDNLFTLGVGSAEVIVSETFAGTAPTISVSGEGTTIAAGEGVGAITPTPLAEAYQETIIGNISFWTSQGLNGRSNNREYVRVEIGNLPSTNTNAKFELLPPRDADGELLRLVIFDADNPPTRSEVWYEFRQYKLEHREVAKFTFGFKDSTTELFEVPAAGNYYFSNDDSLSDGSIATFTTTHGLAFKFDRPGAAVNDFYIQYEEGESAAYAALDEGAPIGATGFKVIYKAGDTVRENLNNFNAQSFSIEGSDGVIYSVLPDTKTASNLGGYNDAIEAGAAKGVAVLRVKGADAYIDTGYVLTASNDNFLHPQTPFAFDVMLDGEAIDADLFAVRHQGDGVFKVMVKSGVSIASGTYSVIAVPILQDGSRAPSAQTAPISIEVTDETPTMVIWGDVLEFTSGDPATASGNQNIWGVDYAPFGEDTTELFTGYIISLYDGHEPIGDYEFDITVQRNGKLIENPGWAVAALSPDALGQYGLFFKNQGPLEAGVYTIDVTQLELNHDQILRASQPSSVTINVVRGTTENQRPYADAHALDIISHSSVDIDGIIVSVEDQADNFGKTITIVNGDADGAISKLGTPQGDEFARIIIDLDFIEEQHALDYGAFRFALGVSGFFTRLVDPTKENTDWTSDIVDLERGASMSFVLGRGGEPVLDYDPYRPLDRGDSPVRKYDILIRDDTKWDTHSINLDTLFIDHDIDDTLSYSYTIERYNSDAPLTPAHLGGITIENNHLLINSKADWEDGIYDVTIYAYDDSESGSFSFRINVGALIAPQVKETAPRVLFFDTSADSTAEPPANINLADLFTGDVDFTITDVSVVSGGIPSTITLNNALVLTHKEIGNHDDQLVVISAPTIAETGIPTVSVRNLADGQALVLSVSHTAGENSRGPTLGALIDAINNAGENSLVTAKLAAGASRDDMWTPLPAYQIHGVNLHGGATIITGQEAKNNGGITITDDSILQFGSTYLTNNEYEISVTARDVLERETTYTFTYVIGEEAPDNLDAPPTPPTPPPAPDEIDESTPPEPAPVLSIKSAQNIVQDGNHEIVASDVAHFTFTFANIDEGGTPIFKARSISLDAMGDFVSAFYDTRNANDIQGAGTRVDGKYGSLFISADGKARYVLDEDNPLVSELLTGQVHYEFLEFQVAEAGSDGEQSNIVKQIVIIRGATDTIKGLATEYRFAFTEGEKIDPLIADLSQYFESTKDFDELLLRVKGSSSLPSGISLTGPEAEGSLYHNAHLNGIFGYDIVPDSVPEGEVYTHQTIIRAHNSVGTSQIIINFDITNVEAPIIIQKQIADVLDFVVGTPAITIDLSEVFIDPDGRPLDYSLAASTPEGVRIEGNMLIIEPEQSIAPSEIYVRANSDYDEMVSQSFILSAFDGRTANTPIADIDMLLGEQISIDLTTIFKSYTDTSLTFTLSDYTIAGISIHGNILTINPNAPLTEKEITITASDGENTATDTFTINAQAQPQGRVIALRKIDNIPDVYIEAGAVKIIDLADYYENVEYFDFELTAPDFITLDNIGKRLIIAPHDDTIIDNAKIKLSATAIGFSDDRVTFDLPALPLFADHARAHTSVLGLSIFSRDASAGANEIGFRVSFINEGASSIVRPSEESDLMAGNDFVISINLQDIQTWGALRDFINHNPITADIINAEVRAGFSAVDPITSSQLTNTDLHYTLSGGDEAETNENRQENMFASVQTQGIKMVSVIKGAIGNSFNFRFDFSSESRNAITGPITQDDIDKDIEFVIHIDTDIAPNWKELIYHINASPIASQYVRAFIAEGVIETDSVIAEMEAASLEYSLSMNDDITHTKSITIDGIIFTQIGGHRGDIRFGVEATNAEAQFGITDSDIAGLAFTIKPLIGDSTSSRADIVAAINDPTSAAYNLVSARLTNPESGGERWAFEGTGSADNPTQFIIDEDYVPTSGTIIDGIFFESLLPNGEAATINIREVSVSNPSIVRGSDDTDIEITIRTGTTRQQLVDFIKNSEAQGIIDARLIDIDGANDIWDTSLLGSAVRHSNTINAPIAFSLLPDDNQIVGTARNNNGKEFDLVPFEGVSPGTIFYAFAVRGEGATGDFVYRVSTDRNTDFIGYDEYLLGQFTQGSISEAGTLSRLDRYDANIPVKSVHISSTYFIKDGVDYGTVLAIRNDVSGGAVVKITDEQKLYADITIGGDTVNGLYTLSDDIAVTILSDSDIDDPVTISGGIVQADFDEGYITKTTTLGTGASFTAHDPDNLDEEIIWTLSGDGRFVLRESLSNSYTGSSATLAILEGVSFDYDTGFNDFELTLSAQSGDSIATRTINIDLNNINESAPYLTANSEMAYIHYVKGSSNAILDFVALDKLFADADGDRLRYAFTGDDPNHDTDSAAFLVGNSVIFENPDLAAGIYTIEVEATDGTYSTFTDIILTISEII